MKKASRQLIIKGVLVTLAICCAWAVGNGPLSHHGFSDFAGGIVYAGLLSMRGWAKTAKWKILRRIPGWRMRMTRLSARRK